MRPARVLTGLGIGAMAGFLMAQLAGKALFFGRPDADLIFDALWLVTAAGIAYWATKGATSLAMIWGRGALLGAALWLGYFVELRILSEKYPNDVIGEGGAIVFVVFCLLIWVRAWDLQRRVEPHLPATPGE